MTLASSTSDDNFQVILPILKSHIMILISMAIKIWLICWHCFKKIFHHDFFMRSFSVLDSILLDFDNDGYF